MYFPYFIIYIVIGLILAVSLFLWALKNGQFRDQQRARFLPLEEETGATPRKLTRASRYEILALVLLACAGLATSAAVVIFALTAH